MAPKTACVREQGRAVSPPPTRSKSAPPGSKSGGKLGPASTAGPGVVDSRTAPPNSGRKHHSYADLDPQTWYRWVRSQVTTDENRARRINGRRPSQSQSRQMHRWSTGDTTSFWFADRWCVRFGLSINDYLAYAAAQGLKAWAIREPGFEQPMTPAEWDELCAAWPLPEGLVETAPAPDSTPHEFARVA